MNIRQLLIAEAEKKDILRQYGLITEDNTTPTKTMEVDVKINFRGGYYSAQYADFKNNLDPQLSKVAQFLKAGAGKAYLVTVDIASGESRLPNVDNENGGVKVDAGFLSKERSKTIQTYVTTKLQTYVDNKLLLSLPKFKVKQPTIAGPIWIGQPFCPKSLVPATDPQGYLCAAQQFKPGVGADGKPIVNWFSGKATTYAGLFKEYKDAQFISVKLKLEEMTDLKKCLDGMVIEVNYTNLAEEHKCNNSTYHIYLTGGGANPTVKDKLLRNGDGKDYASLDNNGSQFDNNPGTCDRNRVSTDNGCKRFNKFTVTPEMASQILAQSVGNIGADGKPKFTIWAQCSTLNGQHSRWGTGCHASKNDPNAGVGDIVITNGLKEKTVFTAKTPVQRGAVKELKTINACGK